MRGIVAEDDPDHNRETPDHFEGQVANAYHLPDRVAPGEQIINDGIAEHADARRCVALLLAREEMPHTLNDKSNRKTDGCEERVCAGLMNVLPDVVWNAGAGNCEAVFVSLRVKYDRGADRRRIHATRAHPSAYKLPLF